MDFADFPVSERYYGGTEFKRGILIQGNPFMLKFQKRTPFGLRNNHISEYLGSTIFAMLGLPAQEVVLGTYRGQLVVACRDFIEDDEQFVPFNDVGESSLDRDKDSYQYTYDDIMDMLEDNRKLTDVEATVRTFWQMFVVDALIGNFDRHGANWGFIKKDNTYRLAPIFDNGSCLFPNLTDDQMETILQSPDEIDRRVYGFPTSQILLDGKKSSYFEVIDSLAYPECNKALADIVGRIDGDALFSIVENVPDIAPVRRDFYHVMLENRLEKILIRPYENLMRGRS